MAYLLPKIDQAMQGGNQNQSNIFGQQGGGDGTQSGNAQDTTTKTEDGGPVGTASSSAPQVAKPAAATPPPSMKNREVFNNTAQSGGIGNSIGANVQQQQGQQQQEANAYLGNAGAQNYNVDTNKAAEGDAIEMPKTMGLLNNSYTPNAAAFESKVNTNTGAQNLANEAGIQKMLNERGDSRYSAGESAMDVALLRGNQGFQQQRQGILENQAALENQQNQNAGNLQNQANAIQQANYSTAQQDARQQLGELGRQMTAQQQVEADAENAARHGIVGDKYTKVGGDVNWQQSVTPEEAIRFNRIQTMLGNNDQWSYAGGFGARSTYNQSQKTADEQNAAQEEQKRVADAKAAEEYRRNNNRTPAEIEADKKAAKDRQWSSGSAQVARGMNNVKNSTVVNPTSTIRAIKKGKWSL